MSSVNNARAAIAAVVLAVVFAVVPSGALVAQRSQAVRVAIPDNFPVPDAPIAVLRFASGAPDVVLLRASAARPDALAAALEVVRHFRRSEPAPHADHMEVVQGFARLNGRNPSLEGAGQALALLESQPKVRIGNIGLGRWIELPSPNPQP